MRSVPIFATVVSTFFFVQYGHDAQAGFIGTVVLGLFLVACFFMIWVDEKWWNLIRLIFFSATMVTVTVILYFVYDNANAAFLLFPLVWFLAKLSRRFLRSSSQIAAFTIAVIAVIDYTYPFPFSTVIGVAGLYMGIKAINLFKESYYLSKVHLKELNEAHERLQQAHAELQEATVHSMRYAALSERSRLAREIHDGIGHRLTSLIIQLQALEFMLPDEPKEAKKTVPKMLDTARKGMAEVRSSVRDWSDDESGLGLVALKGLVSQSEAHSALKFKAFERVLLDIY